MVRAYCPELFVSRMQQGERLPISHDRRQLRVVAPAQRKCIALLADNDRFPPLAKRAIFTGQHQMIGSDLGPATRVG